MTTYRKYNILRVCVGVCVCVRVCARERRAITMCCIKRLIQVEVERME